MIGPDPKKLQEERDFLLSKMREIEAHLDAGRHDHYHITRAREVVGEALERFKYPMVEE